MGYPHRRGPVYTPNSPMNQIGCAGRLHRIWLIRLLYHRPERRQRLLRRRQTNIYFHLKVITKIAVTLQHAPNISVFTVGMRNLSIDVEHDSCPALSLIGHGRFLIQTVIVIHHAATDFSHSSLNVGHCRAKTQCKQPNGGSANSSRACP